MTASPPAGRAEVGPVVDALRDRLGSAAPRAAVVLGSGLGGLAALVADAIRIPYAELPGFPAVTVPGHRGELIGGRVGRVPVVLQSGRFHLYEGYGPDTVAFPVRVFAELGVETLVVTNAAGGIRRTFAPPLLMGIADHLNFMWRNPLEGPALDGEARFPDMSSPYDADLLAAARHAARLGKTRFEEGVYAGVLGPAYETPSEIRMLAEFGADAVGMSTVPEVIVARARGLRVLGISTITNVAAGMSLHPLRHADVLAAGAEAAGALTALIGEVLATL